MQSKIARLNRLLNEGYELTEIRSDALRIETRLARGAATASVEFDRFDAMRLLVEPFVVAGDDASVARASRYRVTTPLR